MAAVKHYEMDMCSGSIPKKMLRFAVPLMLSSLLQLLFNAADMIVVGRFAGDTAFAAVSSNNALINLLTNLFIGLSVGANIITAQSYGAGDKDRVHRVVHTAMLVSFVSGIFLTVVGVAGARQFLTWMQAPANVLELAALYLRIYFLGMTSTMVYNFGSAILRAVGDTKRPMYYLLISGVLNVILNLILVIVFHLSVAGVAIATAVSQTVAAILVVRCLIRTQGAVHLDLKALRIHKDVMLRIFRVGIPAGLQSALFSISNVVIQSSINTFGESVIAGNSAAAGIEGFIYVTMNAFQQAALCFVSQNYGAGRHRRITKIALWGEAYAMAFGIVLGGLAFLFGEQLLGIYSPSHDVIQAGLIRMGITTATYFTIGNMEVFVGALRGLGYSLLTMVISLFGSCALRLVWVYTIFQVPQFHTLQVLYLSYPITWALTAAVLGVCFVIARRKLGPGVDET